MSFSTDKDRSIAAAFATLSGILDQECSAQMWLQYYSKFSNVERALQNYLYPFVDPTADFMHRSSWVKCEKLVESNRKRVWPMRAIEFKKHEAFYSHLSAMTHFNISNFDEAKSVYESFSTAKQHGKDNFESYVDKDTIEFLRQRYLADYDVFFPAKLNEKLTGGPTLALIVRQIQPLLGKTFHRSHRHDDSDLLMLFGHTSSMMAITKALGS